MNINRLVRLLTRNGEKMDHMFIFNRGGQNRKRLPIFDAEIGNLKDLWSREVDLLKQEKIIMEHLKIYDCSDTLFDQPGDPFSVRLSPAPENILRHLTESGDR